MAQIYLEIQGIKHERQVPPKAALGSEGCSMWDVHGPHMSVIPASVLQVMKHERQVPPEAAPGPEGCSGGGGHGPHISVILAFALLRPTLCQGAPAPT